MGASGEGDGGGGGGGGGGATAGGAQGPAALALALASDEAAEAAAEEEEPAEEGEGAVAAELGGLDGFWGGTPRTSTWSAQTTALTPSMAKPIARSRMKTVADSAEAEGVCFFFQRES